MRIKAHHFYLSYLFGSTCSKETHFKPYSAHIVYYTIYNIIFISITLDIEEEGLERQGNFAVYSLCGYDHMYTCMHSLNNKSKKKTNHWILKPRNLKDNIGKSIKLS